MTSFDSFFRVEKMSQWCRLFVFMRSVSGRQKRVARPQGHPTRQAQWVKTILSAYLVFNISRQHIHDYRICLRLATTCQHDVGSVCQKINIAICQYYNMFHGNLK